MDMHTFTLVAGGVAVVGLGGYGLYNWNRLFKKPYVPPPAPEIPQPVVKAKRKYTKKPKLTTGAELSKLQEQQQQNHGYQGNGEWRESILVEPDKANPSFNQGEQA